MRPIVFVLLIAAAVTTTFHDNSGFVTGKARTQDGVTTYYDAHGRVIGKARTQNQRR